ncbi:adrenocortical dysplasia protein homolog isoform X3 [Silurus meridionalis]|uniref:adrenocortical dysplasia protein homolog isoform X3 n=1 Tax=Silurus meridionalis TaxID=175797 RepID=UPI001EECB4AC|nr:adrenocortical dysplasia protein homolog isoform X3 [Silurus meridionalis]
MLIKTFTQHFSYVFAAIMRRYRTESKPEPWIEQLIENYGEEQREISVRAHVVGVSDLTESQRTDESDACMLFLSDGTVFIPAVLSAGAWERMQELEERDTFSGLDNTTVSVRNFQLQFHMDPELTTCQFYLIVHHIVTVGRVTQHHRPPSCTTLLSVKQQILRTWRSLVKESSESTMSSQSGLPLSCLLGAWYNDLITDLLNDAIQKITAPTVGHLGMATHTRWHRDRLRCRGEESFSTPVSHLLIPQEQKEMLTADPGVSNKTWSGLGPPHVGETLKRPVMLQDEGGDLPAMASDRLEHGHQLTLNNTRPAFSLPGLSDVWCVKDGEGEEEREEGGGENGQEESPWDLFGPAGSVDLLLQQGSRSLLTNSGSAKESTIISQPFHRPGPSCDLTTTDLHQEPQIPSPLTLTEHIAATCLKEQSPTGNPQKISPHVSHTPTAKKSRVHSDGSSFAYTYEPCPKVASALSQFKVPEQLVQWAAAYLGTPRHDLIVSSGVELRKVAIMK